MDIVCISGGKDSVAMAFRLQELGGDYKFICTPTKSEMPYMNDHWDYIQNELDQELIMLHDPEYPSLISLIDHFQALPNWRMRWCTRVLKIEVMIDYYQQNEHSTAYVGLRADEPAREGGVYGDYVEQVYPLREWGWGIKEVYGYLDSRGVKIPARTDCECCFYQSTAEWWNLWDEYPEIYNFWENKEIEIGHTFRSENREKIWPGNLHSLRKEFEKGRAPRKANKNLNLFGETYQKCRVCSL